MITNIDHTSWLEEAELKDLIDLKTLQKFQDDFANNFGIACITLDAHGNALTEGSNITDFCMKYTRGCKLGSQRCLECDLSGSKKAIETAKANAYTCHVGLIDFASPIIIHGKYLGGIYGGQITPKALEEENIRKVAKELGINEEEYIAAAKKLKVVSETTIKLASEVLYLVGNTLAQIGTKQYLFKKMFEILKENVEQASSVIQELAASSEEVSANQQQLNNEIKNVGNFSTKISSISEFIKKIANETNMLGLNAAIEAARAGSSGAGFSVVAHEIRKLSAKSKETADDIVNTNLNIQRSVNDTVDMSKSTLGLTEQQAAAIEELSASLQQLVELSESLSKIEHI